MDWRQFEAKNSINTIGEELWKLFSFFFFFFPPIWGDIIVVDCFYVSALNIDSLQNRIKHMIEMTT